MNISIICSVEVESGDDMCSYRRIDMEKRVCYLIKRRRTYYKINIIT